MAIVFQDGTQAHTGKLVQRVISEYSNINSYSYSPPSTAQRIWSLNFTPKLANSRIGHYFEVHGYYSGSSIDRNFQCGMNVNGGTHYYIGGNSNNASGNNAANIMGYHRGDEASMCFVLNFQNFFTGNAGGFPSWAAGNTLSFWADTRGEGTFYLNQASQTGDGRFGRGVSKLIIEEYIP